MKTDIDYTFLDKMQEFALIESADSTIKYANHSFCDFYHIKPDDVVGKQLLDFIIPEDRFSCDMESIVTPESPEYRVEGRTVRHDGQLAWIQFIGKGFFDSNGSLVEFQEVGLEITEWKEKIEECARRLEQKGFSIESKNVKSRVISAKDSIRGIGNHAFYTFDDIITQNAQMQTLILQAKAVAKNDSSILIEGESGTGKELFAQSIHNSSNRANGPFVAINCGAINKELLHSELFGYEEGAFTGAKKNGSKGKFELAHMGTLFLDEIGEMPLEQQTALLRVLETKSVTRVGGSKDISVDVRIICATNENLYEMMINHQFREDLYFRLNVINLTIPPLRERKDDIHLIAESMIKNFKSTISSNVTISQEQYELLYGYSWPGNIRELRNIVERILYMPNYDLHHLLDYWEKNRQFQKGKIPSEFIRNSELVPLEDGEISYDDNAPVDRIHIEAVLKQTGGNVSAAARHLNISRKTLYNKLKKYDIDVNRY